MAAADANFPFILSPLQHSAWSCSKTELEVLSAASPASWAAPIEDTASTVAPLACRFRPGLTISRAASAGKAYPAAPPSMVLPDQHTAATALPPTPVTAPASRAAAAAARARLAADNARANAAEVAAHTLHAAGAGSPHIGADAAENSSPSSHRSANSARTDSGGRLSARLTEEALRRHVTPRSAPQSPNCAVRAHGSSAGDRFVPAALPFHCAADYWHGGGGGGGGGGTEEPDWRSPREKQKA